MCHLISKSSKKDEKLEKKSSRSNQKEGGRVEAKNANSDASMKMIEPKLEPRLRI